jgi:hypothetical protein
MRRCAKLQLMANLSVSWQQRDQCGGVHPGQRTPSDHGLRRLGSGRCCRNPTFTHAAFYNFQVFTDNVTGGHKSTEGRLIPFCLFLDPELARVGLNEMEAKARGIKYRLFKLPIGIVLRTRATTEKRDLNGYAGKGLVRSGQQLLRRFDAAAKWPIVEPAWCTSPVRVKREFAKHLKIRLR